MEMSVRSMKSNSVSGIMAEYPEIVTYRKTSLENISPQLSFCSMKFRVCQMPIFLKMIAPTSFSHDIYPKEYENTKKVEKS